MKRTGKVVLGAVAAVIGLGIVGSVLGDDKPATSTPTATVTVAAPATPSTSSSDANAADASTEVTTAANPATPEPADDTTEADPSADDAPAEPAPAPPAPRVAKTLRIEGTGARVTSARFPADVTIVRATHAGSSNFVVETLGDGGDLLVNEIGAWSGQVVSEATTGKHRIKVDADGAWTLTIAQPNPAKARPLLGRFKGKGSQVFVVRLDDDAQPVFAFRHRGESNFVVQLYGYDGGGTSGSELLVNEIGTWAGETTTFDTIPAGGYLLAVQADGTWTGAVTE